MKEILITIGAILITGIVVLLCFSSCYLAGIADKYWESLKEEMEKRNERR
jgi:hypothetical protein